MKLANRVAIVTGAAQGIGRAIATGLAREGASVVIADLQGAKAETTAAAIVKTGVQTLAVQVDVTRLDDLTRLFDMTVAQFGRVDILVNNAGFAQVKPFFEVTEADWDRQLAVNLKAAFFATQRAALEMTRQPLRHAEQRQRGKIVNLASTSSFVASSSSMVPYDISKAGVHMLSVSAAGQLAPHRINVNAIAPGTIDTDLVRALADPEKMRWYAEEKIPLGRLGQPEDLVGAVVFLCSDDSDYVTGHTLVIDGGWMIY